ncbi:S-adenosyl-L-methionine-dependent methyltransferase [Pseudovirgaria hyperparasitica]|uniref:S-adenosyl-L-methionine-dependent methyltransferase n=1 Tax=Pseudovirgaria hyperparasitica TaxID=470096 RepID=A0A6A6W1J9_9PEZI|nr:S-adenosyl-L-methionine-dependent methyltransferase [Pseudovirgaria hyperparasitica]KAF2755447.1 S-adenosyl-L-methionine-dependent methyltransferase [Pseudovirgaria hyperparasitica]
MNDDSDRDSALGEQHSPTTTSITSSAYAYRYELGRRYHAFEAENYMLPNDDNEAERLDLQHHAFRLTLGGALYLSPIPDDVQSVLDVGCGTGIWAIDFADEHPSASVVGIDLSPIQPNEVPPNCSFVIDDAEKEWLYNDQYDFVHERMLCFGIRDWSRIFQQTFLHLKPGGWIECQEACFPPRCVSNPLLTPEDSPYLDWSNRLIRAASLIGVDLTAPRSFSDHLQNCGFVDIRAHQYKWPIGPWPKDKEARKLGCYVKENMFDFLQAASLALFTKVLKMSRSEIEVLLSEVRKDINGKERFVLSIGVWCARKPLVGEHGNNNHALFSWLPTPGALAVTPEPDDNLSEQQHLDQE